MEALHEFLDLMRLPVRLVIGALAALAVFFIAPDGWLSAVGILQYKPTEKTSFGILLLVLIGSVFASIAGAVLDKVHSRRFLRGKREMLESLSDEEKTLLQTYLVRGTKTLHLPFNHGVVQGLVHSQVLYRGRRRRLERKIQIMRMLLATRHMPADAQYNTAINLIPAEFNRQKKVMEAWRRYHEMVREQHTGQAAIDDHNKRLTAAQSTLIFQIMQSVGLRLSEADIQTQVYISQGFIDRDGLYLASLQAMPDIAATMRRQAQLTETLLQGMGRPVPEPPQSQPPALPKHQPPALPKHQPPAKDG